jgi:uncharacterized membrane protein
MRAAKWGLSAILGALSMISVGVGEARSQDAFVVVCNRSGIDAWVAVTAHPTTGDPRFLISGWFEVVPGSCRELYYVGRGWAYFYAETSRGEAYWAGNSQRFCVNYPGPFNRYISDAYNCSGVFLKSFNGYYVEGGTFTWTLY